MEKMMQAYIVSGPDREADMARALSLTAMAVCDHPGADHACGSCRQCRKVRESIHPDVITIEREKNDRGVLRRDLIVEQIRRISADASILPNDAERKVYLLREAELMNTAAQNAFLKLLEEPPAWVVFILVSTNTSLLLPTVRSRCTEIRVESGEIIVSEEARTRAAAYLEAIGHSVRMLELCTAMEKLETAEVAEFVTAARELAPRFLAPDSALLRLEEELRTAEKWLAGNVSARHVLGYLATVEL